MGLLSTVPLYCMALFSFSAGWLQARLGSRLAIAACLALVTAFGLARVGVPPAWAIVLLTVPIGAALGLAGGLMAMAVKEDFADRPAFGTGVYATGLQVGAGVAAAVAVPLAGVVGGWRWALAVLAALTGLVLVAWLLLTRRDEAPARSVRLLPRLPFGKPIVWVLAVAFGMNSVVHYGTGAWLADSYVERGWNEETAGVLVSLVNLVGIPATLVVPWVADRVGSRRFYLVVGAALTLAGLVGVVAVPGWGWFWVVLIGLGGGIVFPVVLTLPLDVADRPADVGAIAGLMLGVGYVLSGTGPVLLGFVRDLTGNFDVSLLLLAAGSALLLVLSFLFSPGLLRRGIARENGG